MNAPADPRDAAADLMQRLITRGIRLSLHAGRIAYDAPADAPADDDVAALRRHKRDVLRIVRQLDTFDAPPTRPRPSRRDARPPMRPARPPRPDADARGALLDAARRAGFPRLPIPGRPAEAVAAGMEGWRLFIANADACLVHALVHAAASASRHRSLPPATVTTYNVTAAPRPRMTP